jgi:cytoskeletal protein CcmA (bactofilin family)
MSLWQKDSETNRESSSPAPHAAVPNAAPARSENRAGRPATIGQSVQIKGELTGQEDLVIDGRIDGKITVSDHHLTIGPNGHVNAEVRAKSVQINGEVTGNIIADDKVEISPSGSVNGDITAPRVALADGSSFKGSIDMGRKAGSPSVSASSSVNRDVPIVAGAKR